MFLKIYSLGRNENHKLKRIHWCQTSSKCFSNGIRQIYRYSLYCTKKALDKDLAPLRLNTILMQALVKQTSIARGGGAYSNLDNNEFELDK